MTIHMSHFASLPRWGIRDHELFATFQLMRPFNKKKTQMHVTNPKQYSKAEILEFQQRAKDRIRSLLVDSSLIPRELVILGCSPSHRIG